ncbi:uncharacterized protein LOC106097905 isoform X1 [Oreochromis niloticus]|uniref:uncharacterized protein LOC106097905 isoform X1 n=1 Tax=Oreochromis niloticus TaxID=8128 RepID=UPI000DF390A0|nr:uncharacterized protein LOC106097905 isoform X1 [Oreochromis niloticus]
MAQKDGGTEQGRVKTDDNLGAKAMSGGPTAGGGVVVEVREKKGPLRAAIPTMPFPLAVICLFLNTFIPGLGRQTGALQVGLSACSWCLGRRCLDQRGTAAPQTGQGKDGGTAESGRHPGTAPGASGETHQTAHACGGPDGPRYGEDVLYAAALLSTANREGRLSLQTLDRQLPSCKHTVWHYFLPHFRFTCVKIAYFEARPIRVSRTSRCKCSRDQLGASGAFWSHLSRSV